VGSFIEMIHHGGLLMEFRKCQKSIPRISRTVHLFFLVLLYLSPCIPLSAAVEGEALLIPMDEQQSNHLKAYGLTYFVLSQDKPAEWLLNYRGGSFILPDSPQIREQALIMNITFETLSSQKKIQVYETIARENMAKIDLDKAPEVAVYVPPNAQPWDDAVRIALEYAQIPYDTLWDEEVMTGMLEEYDWLHLHHEDFSGQYGKFFPFYQHADWYVENVNRLEEMAAKLGFETVQDLKYAVAQRIQQFVMNGGFLFAMCSATETIDISLAAGELDIVPPEIGGKPMDSEINQQLDFSRTFAFSNFRLITDPFIYRFSTINIDLEVDILTEADSFQLFEFSAKVDPIPTILCQNHTRVIRGFLGQTTGFYKETIKPGVIIMGETPGTNRVRYIHRDYGDGFYTFYGGHDPEDFRHSIGDPPTNLALSPNSPGYRLILNNILFPSTQKEKQKT
jgi:hypothetical protein